MIINKTKLINTISRAIGFNPLALNIWTKLSQYNTIINRVYGSC